MITTWREIENKKKAEQKYWKKYQNVSTLQVICYEYKSVVQEPTKTPWQWYCKIDALK